MTEETTPPPQTDFYIKLASEADTPTALAGLYKQDFTTVTDPETGEQTDQVEGDPYLVINCKDYAIDIVGVIQTQTGATITDDEGNQYPETAPIDGWHLNIRLTGENRRSDVESINSDYGVSVNSPSRVWA